MRRLATIFSGLLLAAALVSRPAMIERLVFFPDRIVGDPPPGVQERWIRTADGIRLHAWQATHPQAHTSVVWSHGNGGNIAYRASIIVALAAHGLDVLAYDYRGYGKSEGRPTEAGVYRDAEAAFDAERDRLGETVPIACLGESLGGAVSIRLATRRPCAAVAVVSTFTSLRDVARRHYGPLSSLAGDRFDSASVVGALTVPFFLAHGDRDEIVPYELGERLFLTAPSPKQFLRIPGARHNDVFERPLLIGELARFLREGSVR